MILWFRLYHEARTDAKLKTLSDSEFRVWFNLLCFSSEHNPRGTVEIHDEELLAIEIANGDLDLFWSTVEKLKRLRILHGDCNALHVTHWKERQAPKPSDEPEAILERVRRHRERKRSERETECNADVTPCNAPVTRYCNEDYIREDKNQRYIEPADATEEQDTRYRLKASGYTDQEIAEAYAKTNGVKPVSYMLKVCETVRRAHKNGHSTEEVPHVSGRNDAARIRAEQLAAIKPKDPNG